jgi:hypothetical protein
MPEDFELPSINPRQPQKHRPPPGKGRVKGQPNFFTKDLRSAIMQAANNVGDGDRTGLVAYLEDLARFHKKAFANLLGKALPLSISADVNSSSISEIRVISVPAGSFLSQDDVDRLATPGLQLEHDPQPVNGIPTHAGDVEIDPASQTSPSDPRDPGAHRNGCEGQPDEAETIADLKRQINELARKAGLPIAV